MGDRYILEVKCDKCGKVDDDVAYAPTSGFMTYECKCGNVIDLEKYTGIDAESTASTEYGVKHVRRQKKELERIRRSQESKEETLEGKVK